MCGGAVAGDEGGPTTCNRACHTACRACSHLAERIVLLSGLPALERQRRLSHLGPVLTARSGVNNKQEACPSHQRGAPSGVQNNWVAMECWQGGADGGEEECWRSVPSRRSRQHALELAQPVVHWNWH